MQQIDRGHRNLRQVQLRLRPGAVRVHKALCVDPAHPLQRPHEVGVLAAEMARRGRLHVLLGIGQLLALVTRQEFGYPLRERPAARRRLPLDPQQPIVGLHQPVAQPHPADLVGRGRHADQFQLVGDLDVARGRVLPRHRQDLPRELGRRLVRHPRPPARLRREPLSAVPFERLFDLVEMRTTDPGDLARPADILQLVRQG